MDSSKTQPETPKVAPNVQLSLSITIAEMGIAESDVSKVYWALEISKGKTMTALLQAFSTNDDEAASYYMEDMDAIQELQNMLFDSVAEIAAINYEVSKPTDKSMLAELRTKEFQKNYRRKIPSHE